MSDRNWNWISTLADRIVQHRQQIKICYSVLFSSTSGLNLQLAG
jgi:hypothetical protein